MKCFIIKIGGNVLDAPDALEEFLKDFAAIDAPKILVHGGGKIATKIGEALGIESKYVDGRRITDARTLELVTMVYGGLVNKQLVAKLQAAGCNAIGLTGADGNVLPAHKRPVKTIDYGFVGDTTADAVNTAWLYELLAGGTTPVFAPLTHDNAGTLLNTNADTIASVLAMALSTRFEVRLIFCFEKKGVLLDVNDPDSVIRHLSWSEYNKYLLEGAFADGILPKLENAYSAIQAGVQEVLIGDAADLIKNTSEKTEGTLITN
ncbi:MAG: acetylglutamate kinase [Saprospiraceae bacterium]|nr:acetylglutamate kinase [Saprospiraceae bacterium]